VLLKIMLSIMAEASKKHKDLSIEEKQRILECYNKLPKMRQRSAVVHLKISQPLLCKILKNRSDIETSALTMRRTWIGREHDRGRIVKLSQH
jgi:hypothetical protein